MSHCGCNLHFSDESCCASFHASICMKCQFRSSAHLLSHLWLLIMMICRGFFFQIHYNQWFPTVWGYLFILFTTSFEEQTFLILLKSNRSVSFVCSAFLWPEKSFPSPKLWEFSPTCFLKCFIVLSCTYKTIIQFELMFIWCESGVGSSFLFL